MKQLLIPTLILLACNLSAQSSISSYEKFVTREGALILTSSKEVFSSGGLESLEISHVEARDETRNGETIKAIVISVAKSEAYLSKAEALKLTKQMERIQLLLVDGKIGKEHSVTYNIRNNLLLEISYSESKKAWKYGLGVQKDDKKRIKDVTATEFQDIKAMLEKQVSEM